MSARLATWNVHGFVGGDGVRDVARTFDVIRRLDADVVALQEVTGSDWPAHARAAGYRSILGRTKDRVFGNALLSRLPVVDVRRGDLSVPGREPRGFLDVVLGWREGPLRVIATHLGLRATERRRQALRLARHLGDRSPDQALALLGDLNDWTPWGAQLAPLRLVFGRLSRIRTFPSRRPVLCLDRIGFASREAVASISTVADSDVLDASDHRPLIAAIRSAMPRGAALSDRP